MNVRIIIDRFPLSRPLWFALAFIGLKNSLQVFFKDIPDKPYIVESILTLSSADAATHILLALFTVSALFAIHIESPREDDVVDKFLSRHLPGILLGVGLGCFFGTVSLVLAVLYGLAGVSLMNAPKYNP